MNPFIIAELSCSHRGSQEEAYKLVDAAAHAGADAIKLQTFNPAKMAIPGYEIESGPWKGKYLRDLYFEAHTPEDWIRPIFERAQSYGMLAFSTPFDIESLDYLEKLACPMYKIASFELVDLNLIQAVANTGKPMIISTGMADFNEIRIAVSKARACGNHNITLLHCVSQYPAHYSEMNLKTINALRRFGCSVGLSDHSLGTEVAVAATALGAEVIEKHLTLNSDGKGLDDGFAMEPQEFKRMVDQCRNVSMAIGEVKFGGGDKSIRRSLYYAADLPKGTVLNETHMKTARPALGANPVNLKKIIGKTLTKDVKLNDPVQIERSGIS